MKYLLKITLALILSFTFYACSNDNSDTQQEELQLELSDLKINLDALDFNKPQTVFTFKDQKDAKIKSNILITTISNEIDDIIASNDEITNVLFKLKFNNGKAILYDIYVLNAKKRIIINGTVNTAKNEPSIDWESVMNGARCPSGWNDNGSCSSRNCIANTTAEILSDPDGGINSSGDCTQIQYNRGLFSVRICSTSC